MLRIHLSNRFEALSALLVAHLGRPAADPGADVFAADTVIVPSAAVQRAVTLAVADAHGICARVEFGFLAQWLWQQIARVLPAVGEHSPFAPAALAWRVYAAFGDPAFTAAHPRLQRYLQEGDAVMRYELARRSAALIEQLITYRPDWLEAWRDGRGAGLDAAHAGDERWQAALWRRLVDELGVDAAHPARRFVQALGDGGSELARACGLPARAHLFVLPTMPPLHVELLAELGRWIELDLYVLNPCREYWFELIDRRRLSRLAARGQAAGHEEGNRLLAAWGQQTQAHIDGLIDRCGHAEIDDAHYAALPGPALLARLHNAVLDLQPLAPRSLPLAEGDRSVEVHVCHSLTRELEVLHDRLLGLFAADPALRPGDVLVVTPDLDAAAPLIDAVFGTVPAARRIPYAITGRARSRVNAPARVLLELLALAASRVTASDVFALLQQPPVARRFGLDDDALQRVHRWFAEAGMRWGLDAAHRAGFGVPADARHSFDDGLQRLFLGYALPAGAAEPWAGRLPAGHAEGSAAQTLGALWQALERLRALQAACALPRDGAGWAALLQAALADFVAAEGDALEDLRELQDTLRELAGTMQRGGAQAPVPLAVLRAALEPLIDEAARGGVPGGSVTFSGMSPLRSLPFGVICVIGLDDGAFPAAERPLEFDLLAAAPRRGDRQRRRDDRNLFLDLLLAARTHVHLSYAGRSVRDNSLRPPSVLLADLLDVLVPAVADDPASAASLAQARARLVVEHPLQPFALEAFSPQADPRRRSHDEELAQALRANALAPDVPAPRAAPHGIDDADIEDTDEGGFAARSAFFGDPLPPAPESLQHLTLAELVDFFRQPSRALLRRRLGIVLWQDDETLADDEPFVPDAAARRALAERLLPPLLAGTEPRALATLAQAGIELPAGVLGEQALQQALDTLGPFAERVRAASAEPLLPPFSRTLVFELGDQAWQIDAAWADLRPSGLLRWRCGALRPVDRLQAWLQHLALCCAAPPGVAPRTTWLALDATLQFRAVTDAHALLADLLRLLRQGLHEPLPFYPRAAWLLVTRGDAAARSSWQGSAQQRYAESTDPAYRLALRGHGDPLAEPFPSIARAIYEPLLEHQEERAA